MRVLKVTEFKTLIEFEILLTVINLFYIFV